MARRSSPASRRRTRIALVALLAVVINLPIVHSTWTRWRIEASGTDVTATVVDSRVIDPQGSPDYFLIFRYDDEVDPDQEAWPVQVDRETYDEGIASGRLDVRIREGRPESYVVEGEERGPTALLVTLFADAVLLVLVLMVWRFGGRPRRPYLRVAATEDVRRCAPGAALERVEGNLYVVRGEVTAIEEDEIVLDLGDRDVYVDLHGHANPVGYQQPAEVRGLMVE